MSRGAAAVGLFALLLLSGPCIVVAGAEAAKDLQVGNGNSLWVAGLVLLGAFCWAVTRKEGKKEDGPKLGDEGNFWYSGPKFWARKPKAPTPELTPAPEPENLRWTHLSGMVAQEPTWRVTHPEDPMNGPRVRTEETREARLARYRRRTH